MFAVEKICNAKYGHGKLCIKNVFMRKREISQKVSILLAVTVQTVASLLWYMLIVCSLVDSLRCFF